MGEDINMDFGDDISDREGKDFVKSLFDEEEEVDYPRGARKRRIKHESIKDHEAFQMEDMLENIFTESKVVNILKKYTENALSEKPWFDGLDIKISSYQTSHKNKHGVYYVVSVPILIFRINTKSISDNKRDKLDSEIQDIVFPLFNSLFPHDEYENPEALWDINFDFHL